MQVAFRVPLQIRRDGSFKEPDLLVSPSATPDGEADSTQTRERRRRSHQPGPKDGAQSGRVAAGGAQLRRGGRGRRGAARRGRRAGGLARARSGRGPDGGGIGDDRGGRGLLFAGVLFPISLVMLVPVPRGTGHALGPGLIAGIALALVMDETPGAGVSGGRSRRQEKDEGGHEGHEDPKRLHLFSPWGLKKSSLS